MNTEAFDLFLILLKLKSYLISMLEHPSEGSKSLEYTDEFLMRRYPERRTEIFELLADHNIRSDSEIAFDEKIHHRFKEMVKGKEKAVQLSSILENLHINSIEETIKEKTLEENRRAREQKLKEIVSVLLQLARIWTKRNEIENEFNQYSLLEEESLIRPHEELELSKLDREEIASFDALWKITEIYLQLMVDYYFEFGGNVQLEEFMKSLDELKRQLKQKYKSLYEKSGLNPHNSKEE